jgi:hypothetical protein
MTKTPKTVVTMHTSLRRRIHPSDVLPGPLRRYLWDNLVSKWVIRVKALGLS